LHGTGIFHTFVVDAHIVSTKRYKHIYTIHRNMKLGIVNSDSKEFYYGGVSPIMRNMHRMLAQEFDLDYIYLPDSWKGFPAPGRIKIMAYLLLNRQRIKSCDFILSHIPEGSYVVSFMGVPYSHIYHGNTNPMVGSKYRLGKYFAFVFEKFFKRIRRTCPLRYTVGPVFEDVKKLPNPIKHSVKPKSTDSRSGFIFAGRLECGKNIDHIIEIYSKLPSDIRSANKLYIAGMGTQRHALEQKAADCGVAERTVFLGSLPNEQLVEADSTKKILLMASSFEGFPTAIAEAFTVGVPVVTTDVGDIPSYVHDGCNGRVLPLGFDDNDYIDAISDILDNYDQYSRNALASASVFDSDTITRNVIDDIKHVLSRQK